MKKPKYTKIRQYKVFDPFVEKPYITWAVSPRNAVLLSSLKRLDSDYFFSDWKGSRKCNIWEYTSKGEVSPGCVRESLEIKIKLLRGEKDLTF